MRKSVTLIEIIVSAIILSVTFTLIISAFITTRRYSSRANRRLVSTSWMRSASNYLYKEMIKSGTDTDIFDAGQHGFPFNDSTEEGGQVAVLTIDGVEYRGYYKVTVNGGNHNIEFNVTYPSVELE